MAQKRRFQCYRAGLVVGGIWLGSAPQVVLAQIAGDGTLGTQVNGAAIAPCTNICTITGGTERGSNLFHSFQSFSILTGGQAAFNNGPQIQNILVRVTGSALSNLDGVLSANGTANLFLLNPNGIIFGPNAQLNIGGSFIASTANAIQLGENGLFSAADPASSNLLTVNPSALFFNATPHGSITNQSTAGLGVARGQSVLLVGGNVTLDGGAIFTLGSRVELGGVSGGGVVGLNPQNGNLSLNFPAGGERSDITLTNGSQINVRAAGGGDIVINARNLRILASSSVDAGIDPGLGNPNSQAGDIQLNATGAITVAGGSAVRNWVSTNAIGQGGDILIRALALTLDEGAELNASSFGQGNAGKVIIQTQDATIFKGDSTLFNTIEAGAIGNSGGVTIRAGTLTMAEGAEVITNTGGQGNAGDVTLQVRDRIAFDGVDANGFESGVFSAVRPGATGNGGTVVITTGSLSLTNGGKIQTNIRDRGNAGNVTVQAKGDVVIDGVGSIDPSEIATTVGTGGIGHGGDIRITAHSLFVTNGGLVNAATFGQGNGGNITVQAADRVVLDGVNTTPITYPFTSGLASQVGFDRSAGIGDGGNISVSTHDLFITNGAGISTGTGAQGNAGNILVQASGAIALSGIGNDGSASLIESAVVPGGVGNGGTIALTTDQLTLTDQAQLSSSAQGDGNAGNIAINARLIQLDRQAGITTETTSGNGGNIVLQSPAALLLRHNSLISTTAGTAQAGGNGGNITIQTPFILSILDENNDIRANAFTGRGGNVSISAQSLFGIQFQPENTPQSDITASSQFGISGSVTINTPNLDPNRGLVQLPTTPIDPANRIDQSCGSGSSVTRSRFTATGRGGLPSQPDEALGPNDTLPRLATLPTTEVPPMRPTVMDNPAVPITEAQTAVRLPSGKIRFVTQTITAIPDFSQTTACGNQQPTGQWEVNR